MTKYVKKDYEIVEGFIENAIPEPITPTWKKHETTTIALPDRNTTKYSPLMPDPKERFEMIRAARMAGITVGAKVIRVGHIKLGYIDDPRIWGIVQKYLWQMMPGYTEYLPIQVRFTIDMNGFQDLPFRLNELETLENAKKQLGINDHKSIITDLQGDIISDLLKERHGVVPFRDPKTYYH